MALALGIALLAAAAMDAGAPSEARPEKRYGLAADPANYPQATPKEALASALKAIDDKRIDYLLAQLTDPQFVDGRVQGNGGHFEDLVKETTAKLAAAPGTVKQLRRFLKEGEWKADDASATVRLKDVDDRAVHLRKAEGRWFLENRNKPD
jgi:hypothetical protein